MSIEKIDRKQLLHLISEVIKMARPTKTANGELKTIPEETIKEWVLKEVKNYEEIK